MVYLCVSIYIYMYITRSANMALKLLAKIRSVHDIHTKFSVLRYHSPKRQSVRKENQSRFFAMVPLTFTPST